MHEKRAQIREKQPFYDAEFRTAEKNAEGTA